MAAKTGDEPSHSYGRSQVHFRLLSCIDLGRKSRRINATIGGGGQDHRRIRQKSIRGIQHNLRLALKSCCLPMRRIKIRFAENPPSRAAVSQTFLEGWMEQETISIVQASRIPMQPCFVPTFIAIHVLSSDCAT